MKIDAYKSYGLYTPPQTTASHTTTPTTQDSMTPPVKKVKQDTVSFSGQSAAQGELGRVAQDTAKQVYSGASAAKLAALKQQVESGSYSVNTQALAQSMLGGLLFG